MVTVKGNPNTVVRFMVIRAGSETGAGKMPSIYLGGAGLPQTFTLKNTYLGPGGDTPG